MKHSISAATDVASICVFDAAALPDDFDELAERDRFESVEAQARNSCIWLWETGADGSYLLEVRIDEPAQPNLPTSHRPIGQVERFHVPSGTLWACGAEYVSRNPKLAGLDRFPHMGGSISLPPGDYALMAWTNSPIGDGTQSGSEKLPPWKATLRMLGGLLIAASLAGILLAIAVTLYVNFTDRPTGWLRWLWLSVAVTFFAGCLPFGLFRKQSQSSSSTGGEVPTAFVELRRLE